MIARLRTYRADGRPPLLRECAVLVALNVVYTTVVRVSAGNGPGAVANGRSVERVERWLGLGLERVASTAAWHGHLLAVGASVWYVTAQWAAAAGVVIWLWFARPGEYVKARRVLLLLTGAGLAVFLVWPVAPPRLAVPGVVDVVARLATPGNFHRGAFAQAADQYGAFPSLHVAWAVWCAWVCWPACGLRGKVLWGAYVLLTCACVVLTGNHYVLDVVGGAVLAPVCFWVHDRVLRTAWARFRIRRTGKQEVAT
jgi:membrane-associated phospholipid phosphatase